MNIFTFVAAQVPDHDEQSAARYWDVVGFLSANLPMFALVSTSVLSFPRIAAQARECVAFGVPNVRRNVCEAIADRAAML